jgi:hypothetical protein
MSKYEDTLKELSENRDGGGKRTEVIHAFWSHDDHVKDDSGEMVPMWLFREYDVSPTFLQCFGTNWHLRVYSYDVWKEMLDRLSKSDRKPKQIEVDIEYEWRQLSKLQFAVYVRDVRITPLSLEFLTDEPVPVAK